MTVKTAEEILRQIKNVEVDEYSTPCTVTAGVDASFDEIATKMQENGIRHIPIVDGNQPVGMISDRDIRNIPPQTPLAARDIMHENPYTVHAGTLLRDVVFEMSEKKIGSALVMDENANDLMIFTSVDALNALNEVLRGELI